MALFIFSLFNIKTNGPEYLNAYRHMALMFNTVIECCAMHLNHLYYIIIVFKKREKPARNFRKFVINIAKLKLCLEFIKHTKRHIFSIV